MNIALRPVPHFLARILAVASTFLLCGERGRFSARLARDYLSAIIVF
jgi:hypothetical protein